MTMTRICSQKRLQYATDHRSKYCHAVEHNLRQPDSSYNNKYNHQQKLVAIVVRFQIE